jgi:hypothetical protein
VVAHAVDGVLQSVPVAREFVEETRPGARPQDRQFVTRPHTFRDELAKRAPRLVQAVGREAQVVEDHREAQRHVLLVFAAFDPPRLPPDLEREVGRLEVR